MNVHVPGQEKPVSAANNYVSSNSPRRLQGYAWFISIISVLAAFAVVGGYSTYRFMVRR
jgi:magnesium transporter